MTNDQVEETTTVTTETTTTESTETYEISDDAAPLPAHLWPCCCLPNSAAAHRAGCEGVWMRGTRQVNPGEVEEIEYRADRGQLIPAGEALALVNTIKALTHRVMMRYEETTRALMQARDAERALADLSAERQHIFAAGKPVEADLGRLSRIVELQGQLTHSRGQETMLRTVIEERDARVAELASQLHQAQEEINRRYTKQQLGDLQASEAELVSAPLRARAKVAEMKLADALVRIQELEDAPLRMRLLTRLDSWQQAGQQLRELLHDPDVDRAIEDLPGDPLEWPGSQLVETIRQTRHLVGEQSLRDLAAGVSNQPVQYSESGHGEA